MQNEKGQSLHHDPEMSELQLGYCYVGSSLPELHYDIAFHFREEDLEPKIDIISFGSQDS